MKICPSIDADFFCSFRSRRRGTKWKEEKIGRQRGGKKKELQRFAGVTIWHRYFLISPRFLFFFFFIQAWHTGFWVVHRFYTIPRYILFSPSFRSFGTHRNFERKERKHTLCDSIIISSMVPYFYFEIYSVPCVFFLLLSLSHSSLIVTEKYYAVWDILGLILPRSRSSLFTRPFREKINPFGTGDVLRFFLSTNFSGYFLN